MAPILWSIFLVSSSTLVLEITLTRVFSVAQGYHFAFLAVSLALLGFGGSGTLLAVFPRLRPSRERLSNLLSAFALLFSISIPVAHLIANHIPFDSYQIAWDPKQVLYLSIYYLALVFPFTLAGLVVGASLTTLPGQEGRLYAANLAGSGLGVIVALVALDRIGGEGTILVSSIIASLASLPLTTGIAKSRIRLIPFAILTAELLLLFRTPEFFTIRMSPYKSLAQALRFPDTRALASEENAFSRVDLVEGSALHLAPGLSLAFPGQLPPQTGITVDGDDMNLVLPPNSDLSFLDWLPTVLPYRLRENPRVLILEPRGGLDILMAFKHGAREIVAVQSNPAIVDLARYAYAQPQVQVGEEIGRSYLARSQDKFDLIIVSLSDAFRPVTSGAYSLQENYTYTTEAFVTYLEHLKPEGILVVPRWFQVPSADDLRATAIAVEALRRLEVGEPGKHIAAIRSFSTALILVKRSELTTEEVATLRDFAQERQFDLIYYWGMPPEEADRFYILEDRGDYWAYLNVIESSNPQAFFANYDYDVSPPTDDRPFFFHFFTLQQIPEILATWGKVFQPFGGSGFLVLWALLALALVASMVLILLPLLRLSRVAITATGGRFLLYFIFLGLGFLFVEIPLIQKIILFLGHPVYALGAVLFGILVFSGLGSYLSSRVPSTVILILAAAIFLYPIVLPLFFDIALGWPLGLRLVATVIALGPLGALMGVPFPKGLALVGKISPGLVPWVWGVNGFASVLASILAAMLALSNGFSFVLGTAGVVYLLAWITIIHQERKYNSVLAHVSL